MRSLVVDSRWLRGSGGTPGDIAARAVEVSSVQQPPVLTSHEGGRTVITDDSRAYELIVEACEEALTKLCVSEACAAVIRRVGLAARRAGRLPPPELRLVQEQEAG